MTAEMIAKQVELLYSKNTNEGCGAMNALLAESKEEDKVYQYMDVFSKMLCHANSYVRNRGLLLIAANARWDMDYKIDEIIESYLLHVMDEKPITSRQCIKGIMEIAEWKPDLKRCMTDALKNADSFSYHESMGSLLAKDIAQALAQIETDS